MLPVNLDGFYKPSEKALSYILKERYLFWTKQVGDTVEVDETLLEVATDKVDTEVPSPEAGVLVEILAEEGDVIEVGKAIAIIETDADAVGDVSSGGSEEAKSEEPAEEEAEEAPAEEEAEEETVSEASGSDEEGERIEVQMPQMGESVVEATVIGWSKQVGDKVEEDETLLEISTDKVDTEVPSPAAGTLVEILAEENDTIEVGQTIAVIATGKAAASGGGSSKPAPKKEEKKESAPAKQEAQPAAASSNGASGGSEPQRMGSDGRFYSPLVRSIAKEEGISQEELENIDGSGQNGRVSKQDILSYVEDKKAGKVSAPVAQKSDGGGLTKPASKSSDGSISAGQLDVKHSPSGDVEVIKMDRMRKMIAEHMVKSKQTSAHVTTFAEVDVTNMVKWRNANKAAFQEKTGTKLPFTPLFV